MWKLGNQVATLSMWKLINHNDLRYRKNGFKCTNKMSCYPTKSDHTKFTQIIDQIIDMIGHT